MGTSMLGFLALLSSLIPTANLYVAPNVVGTGSGDQSCNAAAYTDTNFWNTIQSTLSSNPVTVWFMDGEYGNGDITFQNRGSATNRLYLKGMSSAGAILTAGTKVQLQGSRNIEVYRLNFTGNCSTYAVLLQSRTTRWNDCHDIVINSCTFSNMPDLYYGAISVYGENTHNITIKNCTFDTIGFDQHAHALYAANNCHDIHVLSNQFVDISGHALDFRNGVSNVVVSDNNFVFTSSLYGQEDACGIILPCWNSDGTSYELFGDYYTICRNTFNFDVDGINRSALRFSYSGTNYGGYTQIPNASEIATLQSGGPEYKEIFLTNAGINVRNFKIYDNIYNSNVFRRVEYFWANGSAYKGAADIYNVFYQLRFEDDFEYSEDPIGWDITETPGEADVYTSATSPVEGARSARLRDLSGTYSAQMARDIGNSIGHGYYRSWVRVNSHTGTVYPFYTTDTGVPSVYWIYGYSNGTWRNNNGEIFSESWTENIWYCIEIEFDFDADKYTVWIDNRKIADRVEIPGDSDGLSGFVRIAPATRAEQGDMQIDSVRLGYYE